MEASFSWERQAPGVQFGPLYAAVQEAGLLADSKTFADAVPRREPAMILADWRASGAVMTDAALRAFVDANFDLPIDPPPPAVPPGLPLRAHIAATWDALARPPVAAYGSALAVDSAHVVPGGRFRELYYWDSYFTLLGLARDRPALAEATVDAPTGLIERHGHVPNGARSYYLTRSQPPLFALMPALTPSGMTPRRRAAVLREYGWWMTARAVRLPDGAVLNRYDDEGDRPRDEAWREDVAVALRSGRPVHEVYRDLRAGAESGWDFSSRWCGDGGLPSIRTTRILPVDLNALLYAVETTLGLYAAAAARRTAIDRHMWSAGEGRYADRDLDFGPTPHLTAATLVPLFAGSASMAQAAAIASLVERTLLAPGGLRTTLVESGEQWDAPNGWAPLQWFAIAGLRRYGHDALAQRIANAWLGTVERDFAATGGLLEKYDIERGGAGGGGEYPVQDGFGWTNGVTAALLDEREQGAGSREQ